MIKVQNRRSIKICPSTIIWIVFLSYIVHIESATTKKLFGHAKLDGNYQINDHSDLVSGFLYSKELAVNDLLDVLDELKNYVARYDHQIVCAGMEPKSEMCKIVKHQLALKYFEAAINTSYTGYKSYVWRQIHNDELYGVMLILDPKQGNERDEMHQILRASTYQRDICASLLLESGNNERLRYIRLHNGPDKSLSELIKNLMMRQFVEESTQLYLCTEYKAAGVHNVAIFANQLSLKHFVNTGFEMVECGSKLYEVCGNSWFKNRCLMVRTITAGDCRST
ncbi:hypothetical protein Smp_198890 [Schistosoma mansoni]|uniref:Dopamine N-acetyltransferase-like n=1 Tax=Schistosoma mansoni TaxID=6183 RepID=G4LYW8_SCHMA|nr:hypothetical protein Smp_198890 [Schistosoma mansoni]|eukprot:XP_018646445.1 hypothetical protein Smp_198890 [Schistosoma mansoni]